MSPELSDYEFADGHSNLRKKPSRNVSAKSSGGHESHRSEPPVKKLVSIVSVNSVTDERYIEAQSESSQCQQHKQKMIRYLHKVNDRNKPLFIFNQKLKVGASQDSQQSGESVGTPRFSVVSFVMLN
jgi:hypothetical protein